MTLESSLNNWSETSTVTFDDGKAVDKIESSTIPAGDVQVKVKQKRAPKRSFSDAYKLQILNTFDACQTASERGALLRREGLYHTRLATWRKQLAEGKFKACKTPQSILIKQQLERENAALKKKLAQAEAIIDLQKKVSELLSQHILEPEMNGER